MTPMERVLAYYTLPTGFDPYPYQETTVNELAPKPKQGHYLAVGVGKTFTSTMCALYKNVQCETDQTIICAPPILFVQWKKWLESIRGVKSVTIYKGTPKQRKKIALTSQFIIMTYAIFKKDYDRIVLECNPQRTALICEEATAIKSIESGNYEAVRSFSQDGHLMLLTGTPLSKPEDAYAYINLIAPGTYQNYHRFCTQHVAKLDFFDKPCEYDELEVIYENMKINSVRILKEDVLDQLPEIQYTPIHYDLAPEHQALYEFLAEQQVIEFADGSKIDATGTTRLWHALQQIVCNYGHFAGDATKRATIYDLIDQTMEELGEKKLIIFTNYRMTSKSIWEYCKKWGAVAVYGDLSDKQVDAHVQAFLEDPKCQVMVAQTKAGGMGWNPQYVCADILFAEEPLIPIDFEQNVGRVYRNGQKFKCNIRVAVAQGTLQVHLMKLLLDKDYLVGRVIRTYQDLRDALYGREPLKKAA